jgi:hypothetical protein
MESPMIRKPIPPDRRKCRFCHRVAKKHHTLCETCSNALRPTNFAYKHPSGEWSTDDEISLLRHFCLKDFWTFFLVAFGAGDNPKAQRWIDPYVHRPLAQWFQKHIDEWLEEREAARLAGRDPKQKYLAIVVHREVGKTTLITRAGQAWLHVRDPEMSTATGAENMLLSQKMLSAIKAVLDGSDEHAWFSKLYGDWKADSRTWSGKEVVHAARKNTSRQDPSLIAFAVEVSITGSHPDALFYDDPISYERLQTDENWLETVNSQITSLGYVVQSDGLLVFVGTRYDKADQFGVAFATDGVASLEGIPTDSIKVDPENGKWHVYFLAGRDKDGQPTTPRVWPEDRLRSSERRDPLRHAAQIMNDPGLSSLSPLTAQQCRQCVIPAKQVPWSALSFAITTDLALWDGEKVRRKDETVFEVWGYPKNGSGDIYFIEGYSSPTWRAEDFSKRIVSTVQRYRLQGRRVFAITGEVAMAGHKGFWEIGLKNFFTDANEPMPRLVSLKRHAKKKEIRLGAASLYWVDGHVRLVEGSPGLEKLIDQMSSIGQYVVNPRIPIDWADAASDAFAAELYQPMRRQQNESAPWTPGATAIQMNDLDQSQFMDDEARAFLEDCPREPLR